MVKMLLKAFSCSLLVIVIDVVVGKAQTPSSDEVAKRLGVSTRNGSFKKFYGFLSQYNKDYKDNQTLVDRFGVFQNNLKVIEKLNAEELGTAVYGITQFADTTEDEFRRGFQACGHPEETYKNEKKKGRAKKFPKNWMPTIEKPIYCDWRSAKPSVVTPIQNQGPNGTCWVFGFVAALESQYQLRKRLKEPAKFSEQEIWDCGDPNDSAYSIIKNDLQSELTSGDVYKYKGKEGECIRDRKPKYKIGRLEGRIFFKQYWKEIKKRERVEDFMAKYVAQRGPIVDYLTAGAPLMHYLHGVIHPRSGNCGKKSSTGTNHAVAIVGFGQTKEKRPLPYWIVKNSCGENFDKEKTGNKGYWYIYRGKNVCNIAVNPVAIKLLPVEFHKKYKASGCPTETILPIGKEGS